MINNFKLIAIVPIKHHSSRVPNKNFRILGDKPLFHHILGTLVKSKLFDSILVDTNSPIIKQGCETRFPEVTILDRPIALCDDNTSTNLLLSHILDTYNCHPDSEIRSTIYFQTHVTNPFLEVNTIRTAIDKFIANLGTAKYDSLFSASKHQIRLYNSKGEAVNHISSELIPTQNLEPLYEENSCMYVFTAESFKKRQHRIGLTPYMYTIDSRIESLDIDWEEDFQIAEAIYKNKMAKIDKMDKIYDNHNNTCDNVQPKRVVLTGASGGIGLATAKHFKNQGWNVIGLDIKPINGNENNYEEAAIFELFIVYDITAPDITAILEEQFSANTIDRIDSWINISAIQQCKPIIETTDADWDLIMNCNLRAIFILSKFAVPYLLKPGGSIVNVASVHSLQSSNNIATYATSKSALVGLTRNMAIEFAQLGIRVNALSPGAVDTNMLRSGLIRNIENPTYEMLSVALERLGSKHLCNRVGLPSEIAKGIYFLANNEDSSYVYGTNLVIDGGATIKLSTE